MRVRKLQCVCFKPGDPQCMCVLMCISTVSLIELALERQFNINAQNTFSGVASINLICDILYIKTKPKTTKKNHDAWRLLYKCISSPCCIETAA